MQKKLNKERTERASVAAAVHGLVLGIIITATLTGCSFFSSPSPLKLGTPKPPVLGAQILERTIPRSAFHAALSAGDGLIGLRLVEVYKRNQELASVTPEYRVFGVRPGGVYDLIGLENADVLVAAHGLVVSVGGIFPEYVKLLEYQSETSLEIRRFGEPKLIKIKFIEDVPRQAISTEKIDIQPAGTVVSSPVETKDIGIKDIGTKEGITSAAPSVVETPTPTPSVQPTALPEIPLSPENSELAKPEATNIGEPLKTAEIKEPKELKKEVSKKTLIPKTVATKVATPAPEPTISPVPGSTLSTSALPGGVPPDAQANGSSKENRRSKVAATPKPSEIEGPGSHLPTPATSPLPAPEKASTAGPTNTVSAAITPSE